MNREEMKQVLYDNIDLIQGRIDKAVDPLAERLAKLEKAIEIIENTLDDEDF